MIALDQRTEAVGKTVVDAAIKIHRTFGPGLLESVYEHCLARELSKRGLAVHRQAPVPITFDGEELDAAFRIDILVDNCVIVEIKAVELLHTAHEAQLLTYLRLSGHHLGYLINFNVSRLIDGLKRKIA